MILIKKVTAKNFLSYGNSVTEFIIDQHKATLMRGKNGHGKSALMDILMFALFGRPYRDIGKPQLINSINKSGMLVELFFSIQNVEYQIVRGMKPAIFDIFRDGVLVEQSAASRDYQELLETQILNLSEKTFKQIAVLGSASYIPFMQLNAGQRRELIESILDIEVFSKMNALLRDRISSTKEETKTIDHKIELKKTEAAAQQKLIKIMQGNTKTRFEELQLKKLEHEKTLSVLNLKHDDLTFESLHLSNNEPEFNHTAYETANELAANSRRLLLTTRKRVTNLHVQDECPTCLQSVTGEHIDKVRVSLEATIEETARDLKLHEKQFNALQLEKNALDAHLHDYKELVNKISENTRAIKHTQNLIDELNKQIQHTLVNVDDVNVEQDKLKAIAESALSIISRKGELSEERHLQDVASQLLKDSGIKTAVVKEYLPVMNQLINKYLAMLDFFVDFTLDENFDAVIRSRGRDSFSYSSFSEGEKRRIDFSILMAFRQLAAMKNSAKTNILILDEIVDGAFDLDARVAFNELLVNIPDSNVIVISHADAGTEHYDRVIHVEKHGDFSSYTVL